MECLEEDRGGGESLILKAKKKKNGTGIHLLNLLISDATLSQRDSASFITFRLCMFVCVCVCVCVWLV